MEPHNHDHIPIELCKECTGVIPEGIHTCLCGHPVSPELQKEIDEEYRKAEFYDKLLSPKEDLPT